MTSQMEFLKAEVEKYKKESESYKAQAQKFQAIVGSQAKQVSDLKAEKNALITKHATSSSTTSTTITSTTTASSEDRAKVAELQKIIKEWEQENSRDDSKIAEQELKINHLNVSISTLEDKLRVVTIQYEQRIITLTEEIKRLQERVSSSQSNDVDDATKISNLHKENDDLRDQIASFNSLMKQQDETANHWKLKFETSSTTLISKEKDVESLQFTIDNLKSNLKDKESDIEGLNSKVSSSEQETDTLKITIAQREKKIKDLEEKITSLNEKVKTANNNSEKFIEKAKKAETELSSFTFKMSAFEKCSNENKKLAEMWKSKFEFNEMTNSSLEKKIIELTDTIKKRDQEIKTLKEIDEQEDKEFQKTKAILDEKLKEIEKWKNEDATDDARINLLNSEKTMLKKEIQDLHSERDHLKVVITTLEEKVTMYAAKIELLKRLIFEIKSLSFNAQELSTRFEIKKETQITEIDRERTKIESSAEYKSLKLEVEQHSHEVLTLKSAKEQALANMESLSKELIAVRAEIEALKNEKVVIVAQLDQEKSMSAKYFEEKKTVSFSMTKDVETEKAYFKSAVETVSTYKEDINRAYSTIASSIAAIEKEFI